MKWIYHSNISDTIGTRARRINRAAALCCPVELTYGAAILRLENEIRHTIFEMALFQSVSKYVQNPINRTKMLKTLEKYAFVSFASAILGWLFWVWKYDIEFVTSDPKSLQIPYIKRLSWEFWKTVKFPYFAFRSRDQRDDTDWTPHDCARTDCARE